MAKLKLPAALAVALALLIAVPSVNALEDSPPSPPSNLEGSYDSEAKTVTLSWDPPFNGEGLVYNVYRNGERVTTTASTYYSGNLLADPATGEMYAGVYFVTSVVEESGQESAPSIPFGVVDSPICSPIIWGIDEEEFPFVHWNPDPACIERYIRTIEWLIEQILRALNPPSDPITIR